MKLLIPFLTIKSILAANYHEFTNCWKEENSPGSPIRENDNVIKIPFSKFQDRTNYQIKLSENLGKTNYQRVLNVVSKSNNPSISGPTFQGFLVTIDSGETPRTTSTGKLQPYGTSSTGKGKIKQVKCHKTSDTIRHRGNKKEDYTDFEYINLKWSSDKFDCIKNDSINMDMKFQVFVSANLPDNNQMGDTNFVNTWFYTEVSCEDFAQSTEYSFSTPEIAIDEEILDLEDMPKIQLKFAKFNSFNDNEFDDVLQKGNNIFKRPMEKLGRGEYGYSDQSSAEVLDDPKSVSPKPIVQIETTDWNEWSKWSECSQSCGYGEMFRTRECVSSKSNSVVSNSRCKGLAKHESKCIKRKCPQWADWQPWSKCSRSCGSEGTKSRQRACLFGNTCKGESKEVVKCNEVICPTEAPTTTTSLAEITDSTAAQTKTCKDKYSFCPHWQKKGYCQHRFTKWMGTNCPVACGNCEVEKPKSKDNCQDRYPISCPRWKAQNRCNHPDKFLRDYIVKNCQLSCEVC